MKPHHFFLSALLFQSACTTSDTLRYVAPSPEQPPRLSPGKVSRVRYPESIKSYALGRYTDPNNPDVLHESHSIYRVETSPRWNFVPGHWVTSGKKANAPDLTSLSTQNERRLQQELERQRLATRKALAGREEIEQTIGQMSAAIERTKGLADENVALKARLMQQETGNQDLPTTLQPQFNKPEKSLHDWMDSFTQPQTNE